MDDKELDGLLGRAIRPLASNVSAAVNNLVDATREYTQPTARKRVSRSLVWGSVAVGAMVLTAGASITAAQMGIPPFQSLEIGTQRTKTAIPVDYVEPDGNQVHCRAFMEFRNLDPAADAKVEHFITANDWSGFGQGLFDSVAAKATASSTATDLLGDAVNAALYEKATQALPGLQRGPADTTDVTFNGSSMSCSPQGK
jgi:hypothetical protein